ncbi:Bsp6I family type II restriction endonuclease [Polynucleobacter paneuropaeus]|nr:Bsp6I family type II restriction endonuclease [Polynucleobacter paneuropaeus]
MKLESKQIKLPEGSYLVNLQFFDSSDQAALKAIYERWVQLSNDLQKYGGRRINLPELLSEAVFCMNFSAGRMTQGIAGANSSFDCYDIHSKKRIQVKACSVSEDLTSFGPDSVWDEIYFIHFYPNGVYDGTYNIYLINNNSIYNHKVNAHQTMKQQQLQGRRPRFSIMREIIAPNKIKPVIQGKL